MTNNTIPHDHHHRHRLRPHHQEMDQLPPLAVKPQAKKQARRRTHTSRPYQERLLNMAEARREIVTALKIHRASTSTRQQQQQQSTYQHHHDPTPLRQPPLQQLLQQQQEEEQQQVQAVAFQDRRQSQAAVDEEASLAHTTMSYAAAFFANPLCNSPLAHWITAGSYCSPAVLPCDLTPPELPPTAATMGGLVELEHYQRGLERLVHSLPARPLGLNLSFQGFGVSVDDGAKDGCEDLFGSLPLTQPSPAASYSYSPPAVETATTHAYGHGSPALSAADAEKHPVMDAPAAAALVPGLDGGEMAHQASGGQTQGGVEWSEAAAADVAAWWSKIFESGQRAPPNAEDVAAGLPPEWRWLCGDDVGAAEQGAVTGGVLATMMHVDDDGDYYSSCYEGGRSDDGKDVTLPCMDGIGDDVRGWDGEWFPCS